MSIWRKLWEGWKRVGGWIGDFISRLILTIFYFTLVLPFGLVMRLFGDPLAIRRKGAPGWLKRDTEETSLDAARRLS
jgi:hypothetical protein